MAGLPKQYFKRFPGNLKKAWAAYRLEKSGGGSSRKKITKVKGRVGVSMDGKVSKIKSKARQLSGRAKGMLQGNTGKVVVGALVATGGAVATSMVINHAPVVKTWSQGKKAGVQFVAGMLGIWFFKNQLLKTLSAGSMMAGMFAGSKVILKVDPMAGSGRTLTPEMIRALVRQGSMGIPADTRMGIPANVSRGGMGIPASVRMNGVGFSNMGSF